MGALMDEWMVVDEQIGGADQLMGVVARGWMDGWMDGHRRMNSLLMNK